MASFFRFSGEFSKNLEKQAKRIALNRALGIGESQLELLKEKLLEEVRNHPVCQEISNLSLPSNFIDSSSGTATLFGFLGFEAGRNPVEELIDFLDDTIKVNSRKKFFIVGQKIVTSLSIPTKGQMSSEEALKVVWSGTAWPILVENGISGLAGASHFLQKDFNNSVSHLGMQVKGVTRSDLAPIPFLSQIFKDFRAKFGSK